jgi:hypothetical protein
MTSSSEIKFVKRLCTALNDQVQGKRTRFAAAAQPPSPLDTQVAEDAIDVSGEAETFWREYSRLERDDASRLFDAIATTGRMPKQDAQDVQHYFDKEIEWDRHVARDGTTTLEPRFKSELGLLAYVANELVARRLPVRIAKCAKCDDLFCADVGGRGQPAKHCTSRCARNAASARYYNDHKTKISKRRKARSKK